MKQINITFADFVIVGVHFQKVTAPVGIQLSPDGFCFAGFGTFYSNFSTASKIVISAGSQSTE